MVEHDSYTNVRIDSPKLGKVAVLRMGLFFFFFFLFFFGLGAGGPAVVDEHTSAGKSVGFNALEGYAYYGYSFQLQPENQLFWVQGRMTTPDFIGMEGQDGRGVQVELHMKMSAFGDNKPIVEQKDLGSRIITCTTGEDYCTWFNIWSQDFIDYDSMDMLLFLENPDEWEIITSSGTNTIMSNAQVSVDFQVQYRLYKVNATYTTFELAWKTIFQIITLMVMFIPRHGYVSRLTKIHQADWSFQQRWVLALLVALFFFNDPFFPATIYSDGSKKGLSVWYMIVICTFIFMLFLFWLCIFDDMHVAARKERQGGGTQHTLGRGGRGGNGIPRETHRTKCYWIPKVIITAAIAITCLASYCYYRYEKSNSPEYSGVDDSAGQAEVIAAFICIFMVIYIIWIMYLSAICFFHINNISLGYRFLFYITMVTIIVCLIGVFAAGFYPVKSSQALFLGFYGTYNLYIWTLGWAYTPVFGIRDHEIGEQVIMANTGFESRAGGAGGNTRGHHKAQSSGDMQPVLI